MKLTPGQLRDAVGLSVDTLRHWKQVLPPFSNGTGHAPCYSTGDLVAALILRRLTENCGVRVGQLTAISGPIVELCNRTPWAGFEGNTLVIDLPGCDCRIIENTSMLGIDDVVFVCPFEPILSTLRDYLLRSRVVRQQDFPFRPEEFDHPTATSGRGL